MYKITMEAMEKIPGCKKEYQIGNTYCAWSRICVAATGETFIASPNLVEMGVGEMNPVAQKFFKDMTKAVGKSRVEEIMKINDAPGHWEETHQKAVRLAIQEATAAGVLVVEDELAKELKEHVYNRHNNLF